VGNQRNSKLEHYSYPREAGGRGGFGRFLSLACPNCGAPGLKRGERRTIDHFWSLFIEVRRYRCYAFNCQWEGNLKAPEDHLE